MTLAIFDLDNTLIDGDSDYLWGQFLCEEGLVDGEVYAVQNDRFYYEYQAGRLDIDAYLRFALTPLRGQPMTTLEAWHRNFMRTKIEPIMLPLAEALIADHRQRGHKLLVITASSAFITRPIVDALGIDDMLACEAEIVDGLYTGEPRGIPSYHAGKVTRLYGWLAEQSIDMHDAYFYSDSHNDLPLLELVDNPIAVDPDEALRARAEAAGWPVISLRP